MVNNKIYIISDEIKPNHIEFKNQKWICDILKKEFMDIFPNDTTNNPREANIIWYLAPWNYRYIPNTFKLSDWYEFLKTKYVIFTQHHIDKLKVKEGEYDKQFEFMKIYGNKFHSICKLTYNEMINNFDVNKCYKQHLWINNNIFYKINNIHKNSIKEKYNIEQKAYLIGSFQKDTEGNSKIEPIPKLSKGPDIFINIVKDLYKENKSIQIILTGLRRDYIIKELNKIGIKYYYFNMLALEQINELYNCLDLYIVSARYEGGPRSIFEAGITKTPIISTEVGVAEELMPKESIYDMNIWETYKNAEPNIEKLYDNIIKLSTKEYMNEFKNKLLELN